MSPPGPGVFLRDHRIDRGVEQEGSEPAGQAGRRLSWRRTHRGAGAGRGFHRLDQLGLAETQHELSGGEVVVAPAVQPEQLGVTPHLGPGRWHQRVLVRDQRLEQVAHLEVVAVALVVVDVPAGQRRLVEVPHEHLLVERQGREPIGVELHDRRIVDAFEQVQDGSAPRLAWTPWS